MKRIFSLLLLALLVFSYSCEKNTIHPSSKITTEEYSFTNYTSLDVSDAFEVEVEFSNNTEQILIESNENMHERIVVAENNNTLEIKLADKTTIRGIATLKAYISTDKLSEFAASGASQIIVQDRIMEPSVDIELSGGSYFSGLITVTSLSAELSGASFMEISGTSASYSLNASGASNFYDFGFSSDIFTAELSGASFGNVTVEKEISIEASGNSSILYRGDASIVYQNLSGGSAIINDN